MAAVEASSWFDTATEFAVGKRLRGQVFMCYVSGSAGSYASFCKTRVEPDGHWLPWLIEILFSTTCKRNCLLCPTVFSKLAPTFSVLHKICTNMHYFFIAVTS